MGRNQLVLLDKLLAQRYADRVPAIEESVAFEIFSAEQAVVDFELSEEEIEEGVIGGGRDGGIDAVYTFLGRVLLTQDSEIFDEKFRAADLPRESPLHLVLVQAKRSEGFSEAALTTVKASLEQLLDLAAPESDLRALYSDSIVDKLLLFRNAYMLLAPRHPKTSATFVYASRGDVEQIGIGTHAKAAQLREELSQLLGSDSVQVSFMGAAELWRVASAVPSYTLALTYQEHVTLGTSHAALVRLGDYLDFITDENGNIRRHVFDMNVRDYQGAVEVNKEISNSLNAPASPEFWWLNNGVTVICSHATSVGKTFQLDNVQIVNGLQTSFSIYETLGGKDEADPLLDRHVLVRVLVTEDSQTRDQVIRATNSQTTVPLASL